jgi:hypothetical protein
MTLGVQNIERLIDAKNKLSDENPVVLKSLLSSYDLIPLEIKSLLGT